MNGTKKWYAVYTRPGWEKKVAERLIRFKIEAYCPLNKGRKQGDESNRHHPELLFTSHVFVHISEQQLGFVKEINGIVNFFYWIDKPAVIKDEEIETIKEFLHQYKNVQLEKSKVGVHTNEKNNIPVGTSFFKEGHVFEVQRKSAKVYLPSLGYHLIAEIERTNIEVTSEFEIKHRLVS